jgi:hypothetical protein
VRDLVGREGDGRILEETLREEVGEGVVLLVEGEDGSVGNACAGMSVILVGVEWE